jgi:uncharacterized membrane protein YhaH (DUF805 family)
MPAVGGAVRWLTDFRGRTTAQQFWPYAIGALVAMFLVIGLGMVVFVDRFMGPQGDEPGVVVWYALAVGGGLVTAIVLLAAPVARRLRDWGASPWIGAAPVPFAGISTVAISTVLARALSGGVPEIWAILLLCISNLGYLGAIAVLLVLLCRSSRPAPTTGR